MSRSPADYNPTCVLRDLSRSSSVIQPAQLTAASSDSHCGGRNAFVEPLTASSVMLASRARTPLILREVFK